MIFTEEQRKIGQLKKEQKKKDGELLDHDWHIDDKNHWKDLCTKHGVRSAVWYLPADATGIRKVLRKIKKDVPWFRDWTGFTSVTDHVAANPRMPLYVFQGIALEQIENG